MNVIEKLNAETVAKLTEGTKVPEFKPGDTFRLPLTATSGTRDTVSYGVKDPDFHSDVGEATLFEFPKGTKLAGYSKHPAGYAKEFGYLWSEAIVAGGFRVVSSTRQKDISGAYWNPTVNVVRLEPTEIFNPTSKKWEKL